METDLESLEWIFRQFPTQRQQRLQWRQIAAEVDRRLRNQHHWGTPALVPGLVHARVATALIVAGIRNKRVLLGKAILTLGAHAGLEVRILNDLGAYAIGIERNSHVVSQAIDAGLVTSEQLIVADYWKFLRSDLRNWDLIISLAPQSLSLELLAVHAVPHLKSRGQLVVVAHDDEVVGKTGDFDVGPALEGTMQWYRLRQ